MAYTVADRRGPGEGKRAAKMRRSVLAMACGMCAGLQLTRSVQTATSFQVPRNAFLAIGAGAAALSVLDANAVQTIDSSAIKTTLGGVKYFISKEGACPNADPTGLAGSCVPKQGSFCVIDYTGFLPNGTVFDTTERKGGRPLAFKLGERQVIVGLEQVVSQMKPGEEVEALVPSELAYGAKGVCTEGGECLIPPNTNLKYFVRLLRTAPAAG